jgi:hypothetical protein
MGGGVRVGVGVGVLLREGWVDWFNGYRRLGGGVGCIARCLEMG